VAGVSLTFYIGSPMLGNEIGMQDENARFRERGIGVCGLWWGLTVGLGCTTQFTCFTSTKVRILTLTRQTVGGALLWAWGAPGKHIYIYIYIYMYVYACMYVCMYIYIM
jgi:hypothetical protein